MTANFVKDIKKMHEKFSVNETIKTMDKDTLKALLEFRVSMIQEEFEELVCAVGNEDAEETVDALIDLIVFAVGTLDSFEIDSGKAWNRVLKANMNKEPGVKPERPNPFGFSDLIKPKGWRAPSHKNNHGLLTKVFTDEV